MKLFLGLMIIFCVFQGVAKTPEEPLPTELPVDKKFVAPRTIEMFNEMNPMAEEKKNEDYWDLAWHAKVADYGDKNSQFLMAQAYEFGKEVEPNSRKALEFYKRAAQQNHFEACMRLGQIYTEQKWVKADTEQALFWYKRAASRGYIPAQLKLSDLYAEQENQNYVEAYYWLAQATRQMFPLETQWEEKAPRLKELAAGLSSAEYKMAREKLK